MFRKQWFNVVDHLVGASHRQRVHSFCVHHRIDKEKTLREKLVLSPQDNRKVRLPVHAHGSYLLTDDYANANNGDDDQLLGGAATAEELQNKRLTQLEGAKKVAERTKQAEENGTKALQREEFLASAARAIEVRLHVCCRSLRVSVKD